MFVSVCLSGSFVASLLIRYKGPAALLCWVRYCWGLIWLHSGLLPSKAAEFYLQIRQCLAKPLYWLAFYLREKADLEPVSLPSHQSVFLPVSHCLMCSFHPSKYLSVTCAAPPLSCLSLSFFCHPFFSFLTSHLSSCPLPFLSHSLSIHAPTYTHTRTHTISAVQHICLVSDEKSAWSWRPGELSCVIWRLPLSLSLPLSGL